MVASDKARWLLAAPELGVGAEIQYTAYGVNIAENAGAAVEVSTTLPLPDNMSAVEVMQLLENSGTKHLVVPPELFYGEGLSAGPIYAAVVSGDVTINEETNTLNLSQLTLDANTDIVTYPENTAATYGGKRVFYGQDNVILAITDPLEIYPPRVWTPPASGTTKYYPFIKGARSDVLRQTLTAFGLYYHYLLARTALAGNQTSSQIWSVYPSRVKLTGLANFSRSLRKSQLTQNVTIKNYNTTGVNGGLVWQATDIYQVNANETQEFRLTIPATLNPAYIDQPVVADAAPVPFTGTSVYVVTGNDGLVVPAARWTGAGGSMTVSVGDQPDELVIRVTGSDDPALSPFTIAEGEYPALYVTGHGVQTNVQDVTFPTGAIVSSGAQPTAEPVVIDNPFLVDMDSVLSRAPWALFSNGNNTWEAQFTCTAPYGLKTARVGDVANPKSLDELIGTVFYYQRCYWRITSLTYDVDTAVYSGTAVWHTLIDDWDDVYDALTVDQWEAAMVTEYNASPPSPGNYPNLDEYLHSPLPVMRESES